MAAQSMVHGTASQQASAALHLERQSEWAYIRLMGTRYVVLPSGRSNSTYWVRADAAGCSCKWSQVMLTACSHRIAVRMAMGAARPQANVGLSDIWPTCQAKGCTDDPEPRSAYCYRHQLVDAF